ncbi:hypothetical protein OC834_007876 [Tilletia horrida]|nr:hypothetical protein OC834_007876 [Tilletia horrida]
MPDTFENRLRAQLAKKRDVDKGPQQLETTKGISIDRQREHEEERNSFVAQCRQLPAPTLSEEEMQSIGTFVANAIVNEAPRHFRRDKDMLLISTGIPGGILYAPGLHHEKHASGWPLWLVVFIHYLPIGLRMLVLNAAGKGARSLNADDILAHSVCHMSQTSSAGVYALQPAGGSIYFGQTERFEARFKDYKHKKLPSQRMESAAEVVDVASWRVGVLIKMDGAIRLARCYMETALILCTRAFRLPSLNTRYIDRLRSDEELERVRLPCEKRKREVTPEQAQSASSSKVQAQPSSSTKRIKLAAAPPRPLRNEDALTLREQEIQERIKDNTFTAHDFPVMKEHNSVIYELYAPVSTSAEVVAHYRKPIQPAHLVKLSGWFMQFWVMENLEAADDHITSLSDLLALYQNAAKQAGIRVEGERSFGECLAACFGVGCSKSFFSRAKGSNRMCNIRRRQTSVALRVRSAFSGRWLQIITSS